MGVYEGGLQQIKPGMHWQHHQERHQTLYTAYDPSRDLSPNLPTTCESMPASSVPSRSNSGCSTPSRLGYPFKEEYDTEYKTSSCLDCGGHSYKDYRCKKDNSPVEYRDYYKNPDYSQNAEKREVGSPEGDVPKVCAGCGRSISDRFYLYAVDRQWHASCLQCSQCGRTLDDEVTCFARDGNIYCKKDYQRLFCFNRCSRCKATISSTELVMRAREYVFHLHCFLCVVCMQVLTKGDHFGLRDGQVYCRLHYESLHERDHTATPSEEYARYHSLTPLEALPSPEFPQERLQVPAEEKINNSFFNGVTAPRPKGRPRKRKPKDLDLGSSLDLNSDSYMDLTFGSSHGLGSNGSHHQRTKRMRTSFKHHQLRTMKTYFTVNHNPDAKDLKQLSQKTGLAKRVLQVWFQNARAKWRRMINKQQENSGTSIKNIDDKSCSENSNSGLDSVYHHNTIGLSSHSPQHYLSPSSLDCSS